MKIELVTKGIYKEMNSITELINDLKKYIKEPFYIFELIIRILYEIETINLNLHQALLLQNNEISIMITFNTDKGGDNT